MVFRNRGRNVNLTSAALITIEFKWKDWIVDALAEKLDARLREWRPETAAEARQRIAEVIELADADLLDLARSRKSSPGEIQIRREHSSGTRPAHHPKSP